MQAAKEAASNMAASAKSGLEKTKATMQEKAERMTTRDPVQKDLATQKKEGRINQAELEKREAREHNGATREAVKAGQPHPGYASSAGGGDYTSGGGYNTGEAGYRSGGIGGGYGSTGMGGGYTGGHGMGSTTYSTTGTAGQTTGTHQMSAVPGHGTGQPMGGHVTEGTYESHPIGTDTGTGRTTANNRRAGGGVGGTPGYGTGGGYSG